VAHTTGLAIPSRSRKNGLRDLIKAGLTGVFSTQETQLSISSELPVAGFLAPSGVGSGRGAAVPAHRAANVSRRWSAKAIDRGKALAMSIAILNVIPLPLSTSGP
jgi:hypothetical protein